MGRQVVVSLHAIRRYQERVADVPDDEAERALTGTAFQSASDMGSGAVILPTGHRAIVADGTVVTVLPKGYRAHRVHRGRHED